jgi:hypothetical protein
VTTHTTVAADEAASNAADEAAGDAAGEPVRSLRVVARAQWPEEGDTGAPPAVPGFVLSTFNPLVVEVAERCLRQVFSSPPIADERRASRISILLASRGGDRTTARALAEAVSRGERVPPLLFFQSNPNAVLGHVAARWGLAGPVISLSPLVAARSAGPAEAFEEVLDEGVLDEGVLEEAVAAVAALIGEPAGDVDEALVIAVEQGARADGAGDRAVALFVAGDG